MQAFLNAQKLLDIYAKKCLSSASTANGTEVVFY